MIAFIKQPSAFRHFATGHSGADLIIKFLCAWEDRTEVARHLMVSDVMAQKLKRPLIALCVFIEPWTEDVSPQRFHEMTQGLDRSSGVAKIVVQYRIL